MRESLKRSGKVGIAKVVIKTRQHLAVVKPENDALVLELMHFSEELVAPGALEFPSDGAIGTRELDMATELISRMSGKWDPKKYTDDYRHAILEMIDKKIKHGGEAPAEKESKQTKPSKVIDLVAVLQESLAHAGKSPRIKKPVKAAAPVRKPKRHLKKAA